MTKLTRPVLRYHGGKWRLAPWIIKHFPSHSRYVEPFCGAASVLFRKPRVKAEIINDLSGDIVNFFRVLRDREAGKELERLVRLTPFARKEYKLACENSDDPIERARRVLVRSFMAYGSTGIFRTSSGFRSLCTSAKPSNIEWMEFPDSISGFVERLQGVVIEQKDACELIAQLDAKETQHSSSNNTLYYVDPPYVHSTQQDKRHKYEFEMSDDDHHELSDVLHQVKGKVIVSGYPSGLYNELYADWHRVARQHVANCAKSTIECLWISPNALKQPSLFSE